MIVTFLRSLALLCSTPMLCHERWSSWDRRVSDLKRLPVQGQNGQRLSKIFTKRHGGKLLVGGVHIGGQNMKQLNFENTLPRLEGVAN